jgi:hypothetical protein
MMTIGYHLMSDPTTKTSNGNRTHINILCKKCYNTIKEVLLLTIK